MFCCPRAYSTVLLSSSLLHQRRDTRGEKMQLKATIPDLFRERNWRVRAVRAQWGAPGQGRVTPVVGQPSQTPPCHQEAEDPLRSHALSFDRRG